MAGEHPGAAFRSLLRSKADAALAEEAPNSFFARKQRRSRSGRIVRRTVEFNRIEALPWRLEHPQLTDEMTECLKTPQGTMALRDAQSWALWELAENRGLLGALDVGAGKTLLSWLAGVVLESERTLILLPASLVEKTKKEFAELEKHWKAPKKYWIRSYQSLGHPGHADDLLEILPDVVVCDEAHFLKNKKAAVVRRVDRFIKLRPHTVFVILSGTLTRTSLKEYAHLAKWALKGRSPIPNAWSDIEDWADLIDENVEASDRPEPGAMLRFATEGANSRQAFRRRFVSAPGVIVAQPPPVDVQITYAERKLVVPDPVIDEVEKLRKTWKLPNGDVCMTALDFARHMHELSLGFYNYWKWPQNIVDKEWLIARQEWQVFVRETIKSSGQKSVGRQTFDSPGQVAKACKAGTLRDADPYFAWKAVEKRSNPESLAGWVSDYVVEDILAWLKESDLPGIVWVRNLAMLARLRARGAICYGSGENGISDETRSCVSTLAHKTGKNLQQFKRNYFVSVPSSASDWEQAVGRTCRPGQTAKEMQIDIALPCSESWASFNRARMQAEYVQDTMGTVHKIRSGQVLVPAQWEIAARYQGRYRTVLWDPSNALIGIKGQDDGKF